MTDKYEFRMTISQHDGICGGNIYVMLEGTVVLRINGSSKRIIDLWHKRNKITEMLD